MSRRSRAAGGEAAPAPPGARDAAMINSIKFSELMVGLEVEGDKFPGVGKNVRITEMPNRTDDNGDRVAVVYLKRPVGRMPMDPPYVMSYEKFWRVGAKTHQPRARDAGDSETEQEIAPAPKRSRAELAQDAENKALQDEADAEERRAQRQRGMERDAADEGARTPAPAPAPPPPAPTQAEGVGFTKEAIDEMNVTDLKGAALALGLSQTGLKPTFKKRLINHLKLGAAGSGCSNPPRASSLKPLEPPPGRTTSVTLNAGQEWFPRVVVDGELSTHEKELLSDEGMKNSSACLLSLEDDELRSTYF